MKKAEEVYDIEEIRKAEAWFESSKYGKGRIAGFVTMLMVDYAKHYHSQFKESTHQEVSDEEIERWAFEDTPAGPYADQVIYWQIRGAKWMRDRSKVQQDNELQDFMNDIHQWADKTFGTERTALAPLHHLKKEVDEAIKAMKDGSLFPIREELADCFILILNASSKYGLEFNTLLIDAKAKMVKNKDRKWGKPDENGVVEHVRTDYQLDLRSELIKLIPDSWLDPLLTGPNKVVNGYPFSEYDIEKLFKAIRNRIDQYFQSTAKNMTEEEIEKDRN